ncbi:methyltransferase family protein [Fodinibius sediminis]|uniref:Protein-S-isoprenylcysteine O-methyltransferase Ste14 n=1 Tax=Fodinibius sediminis TaxID=1214077 RepID=A0A521ELN2_9BACT|nr:isoprenylcysteine carboxylmethyltransferase family protein [Fodinibius sediminis]SMO84829.1 Protein-S-isoprenylcysteine O-methyltransferase Ste14 [Fodinibius sediminis]
MNKGKIPVAHEHWWQTFEVVAGIPFLAALGLQYLVPLALPTEVFAPVFLPIGVALVSVGGILIFLARREFTKHHQPTDPGCPTGKLVTSGIFSVSRHPLYLGGLCVVAGTALALDIPWMLVLLSAAVIACRYLLITPEERYLAAQFSKDYQTYAASVHRWIGRSRW